MATLRELSQKYGDTECSNFDFAQLEELRNGLKSVRADEINSSKDGREFVELLHKFRSALAKMDELKGENYSKLLVGILSVGEDGVYSGPLHFLFELIQNVDDCDYPSQEDCRLDVRFDINSNQIVLKYNEAGFSPFNVFAITGIAEAAKNISADKNEIGEKGIGFKSVFGVADRVHIRSGWFSFELHKDNFTVPIAAYRNDDYCAGTEMTLHTIGDSKAIFQEIKDAYCNKKALFSQNPILFLNKLTSLKMYCDSFDSLEFLVEKEHIKDCSEIQTDDVTAYVMLKGRVTMEAAFEKLIRCRRYSYPVVYSYEACRARYGEKTKVGSNGGKKMLLQVAIPYADCVDGVGNGAVYSFLPTKIELTVPLVCNVPFKLDASREYVDPQNKSLWFEESNKFLAELMDYAYSDWCRTVRENIVRYLPSSRDSLFGKTSEKVSCLLGPECFRGSHYLNLPLFLTVDGDFKSSREVVCFDPKEKIADQQKVHRLLGCDKPLFIPPENINAYNYGIAVEHDVNNKLFDRALADSKVTSEILEYLDSVEYEYKESRIPNNDIVELSTGQIKVIMRHNRVADLFQKVAVDNVKKKMRPKVSISGAELQPIRSALYTDFEPGETPEKVEAYLKYCEEKCMCLDIDENRYMPCYNGIVLSEKNALTSFADFCSAVDSRDVFAVRIKLKEASIRLNELVENETGTASDYLRELKNIRLMVKDSLGEKGYNSYINLILKSGTDKGRFIQEILQNADDCTYPEGAMPSFSIKQQASSVVTEYNETGFSRANIRSITAIGESTKNNILNGALESIGEKGVGFKTIFAVASQVKIHSGDYHFSLTDREPTIPKQIKSQAETVDGTRMELTIKDKSLLPNNKEKDVLEFCLCLRKLRKLEIGNHKVLIEDTDSHRIITINGHKHSFKRFVHKFTVADRNALSERENGIYKISDEQKIVCYVPEKNAYQEYPLYCGLPTKHKIKIPLVIDAPFELTTSREEIETGGSTWNRIIRKEMYAAIISVMLSLKETDRADVLRFARFQPRRQGYDTVYINDISDCSFLTEYPYLPELKLRSVLPTFDKSEFAAPSEKTAYRYPEVVNMLFRELGISALRSINPANVIDVPEKKYDSVLNALGCHIAEYKAVLPALKKYAEDNITDDVFRGKLYEYLEESPQDCKNFLKSWSIIPVCGNMHGATRYIPWEKDKVFVAENTTTSGSNYYVLNENILPKNQYNRILGEYIIGVNIDDLYNNELKKVIRECDIKEVYNYLIAEHSKGALEKHDSQVTLRGLRELIPLKNELGEIVATKLFVCDEPTGYFPTRMIQQMTVHKECNEFAKYIGSDELFQICYDDICYHNKLTADDVEVLQDEYFKNSDDILSGFYQDELLSEELVREYNLEYIIRPNPIGSGPDQHWDFPNDPLELTTRAKLVEHLRKEHKRPIRIISVEETRIVKKGKREGQPYFDLDYNNARNTMLRIYKSKGAKGYCFCQMCKRVKSYEYMEVNSIDVEPKYFFEKLRVALCLECSKKYELLRANSAKRNSFIKNILDAEIPKQVGNIDIPLGKDISIKFTAKHLAEIQEIMKMMPESQEEEKQEALAGAVN